MKDGGLTGKRRFRKIEDAMGFGPNRLILGEHLILQVEVSEWNDAREGSPGKWVNVWRDATPADVQEEVV